MSTPWIARCLFTLFALIALPGNTAAEFTLKDVPDPLKSWVPWALDGDPVAGCPHWFNDGETRQCAWPGALELKANNSGAGFTQDWMVYRAGWITLPGDDKQWPQEVSVDGKAMAVMTREALPAIKLSAGLHHVSGRFVWNSMPESLALPAAAVVLRLDLNGQAVSLPVRDENNHLWLQRKADAEGEEQVQMRVYRKVSDGVPITVETRIRLEVSGKSRELALGRVLLPDLIPQQLASPLPAVLAQDGSLKIQARAGTWDIILVARHPSAAKALTLPAAQGLLAPEEVWVFEAAPLIRSASVEGPPPVDPQQTTLPKEWRNLPAYLMRPDSSFGVKEIRRGDSDPAPDQLELARRLWLSFDGASMTVSDHLQGHISRSARLAMSAPAQLGRADVGGQDQVITRGSDQLAGIEVKRGALNMSADSLLPGAPRSLPAVGWQHDFDRVSMELALPAGWRLLHAGGTDHAEGAWLSRWNLLDFFLVLVIALATGKMWGARWGMVALAALVLSYQEAGAPRFAWLAVLATLALLRVLPAGRFKSIVLWLQRASMLVLLLITLGFATDQLHGALYPVLEKEAALDFGGARDLLFAEKYDAPVAAAMAPPPEAPAASDNAPPQTLEAAPEPQQLERNVAESKDALSSSLPKPDSSLAAGGLSKTAPRQQGNTLQSIDPDATVQTGPGLPDWRWHSYRLSWDGPVRQDQQLDLWLLSPWANKLLVVLRLILLGLLLACIAGLPLHFGKISNSGGGNGTGGFSGFGSDKRKSGRSGLAISIVAFALFATLQPDSAQAQLPTQEQLNELKQKLTRPADCLPACAELSRLSLQMTGTNLRLGLEVDAALDTALPLPGGAKHWLPREARLDGNPAYIQRDAEGELWLLVPAGRHRLELSGDIASRDTLQLPLPLKPRQVEVHADGWDVAGLSDDEGAADTLQLSRRVKSAGNADAPALPPFLRVERRLSLDLVWRVETTVSRASPPGVPALVQIPLLPGEAVTTAGINVKDGKVLVNFGPQTASLSWSSTLAESASLNLLAASDSNWAESWIVSSSTIWHVSASGIPPVASDAQNSADQGADLAFRPWPGEALKLQIERPQAIAGQTMTIDSSRLLVSPGARASDYTLTLSLRSSRGADTSIRMPAGAVLQRVSINGQPRPIRASGRDLVLPLVPGKQTLEVVWRIDQGIALSTNTLPVGLNQPSVNSRVELQLPQERWLLLASGPGIGPAILFWGKLLVLLIVALALGRFRHLPMKTRHWLLLALGLTQVEWWAAALVIAWFFALAQRGNNTPPTMPRWRFNLRQLALAALTLAMFLVLLNAVQGGLLGQPEMQVTGNDSSATTLRWYLDRSGPDLQSAWVLTLPILVYRGLMLAWALWLAWSLLAWLKWGWNSFGIAGLWRRVVKVAVETQGLAKEQEAGGEDVRPK
ncbi:MAG: hypothetical protein V4805_07040 [Pseudomonadota bacterium]